MLQKGDLVILLLPYYSRKQLMVTGQRNKGRFHQKLQLIEKRQLESRPVE